MKTEELLNALTADYAPAGRSFKHLLIFYSAAGFLLAFAIYLAVLGPRPDAVSSLSLWRFDLKFIYTALLAVLAGRICFWTASPGQKAGQAEIAVAFMALAVILLGVCFELEALPKELGDWRTTIEFVLGPYGCSKDLSEVSTADLSHSGERDNNAFCRQGFGTLLERLLRWLAALGCPVVLLSATLPRRKREELLRAYLGETPQLGEKDDAYPRVTIVRAGGRPIVEHFPSAEKRLRLCWQGQAAEVVTQLERYQEQVGRPPPGEELAAADPRRVVAEALSYLRNNAGRMDYPRYRRLGLPTTSSLVESLVGQFNARVKGRQKFWNRPFGGEAILQVRAALLSEDGRLERYFEQRPGSPYRRRNG